MAHWRVCFCEPFGGSTGVTNGLDPELRLDFNLAFWSGTFVMQEISCRGDPYFNVPLKYVPLKVARSFFKMKVLGHTNVNNLQTSCNDSM